MDVYTVIQPPSEHELSQELRGQKLTERSIQLIVEQTLDELAYRRGDVPSQETYDFKVESIDLRRPTSILGQISIGGADCAARLEAVGENDDDKENSLRLVVASDDTHVPLAR